MAFESYKGGLEIGAGFTPSGDGGFPLMQSCDIQVDEEGHTLAEYIESGGQVGGKGGYTMTYTNGVLRIKLND